MFLSALVVFCISVLLSLFVTPAVRKAANRLKIVDQPSARKTHLIPTPRVGGIAIFVSVIVGVLSGMYLAYKLGLSLNVDSKMVFILIGTFVIFGMGLWDDIKGLAPKYKLIGQICAASLAIYGGVYISKITVPIAPYVIHLGLWGVPITIAWYLLIINGINLIDGLDGLAAGVTALASLLLLIGFIGGDKLIVCIAFASISGATLGFLRYNFHPASIFMGDSGSYFIGFVLATLTVMGSVKGQATVAILSPVVALGLPLFDSIFSAIRRFLAGRSIFKSDKEHFHHKLISLGITQRSAVLIFYGITICLGALSIWLMHVNDARAAFVFLLLAIGIFIGVRKLGYFHVWGPRRFLGWLNDLSDDLGLPKERRTFRGVMMEIVASRYLQEIWPILLVIAAGVGIESIRLRLISDGKNIVWREASILSDKPNKPSRYNKPTEKGCIFVSFPIFDDNGIAGFVDLFASLNDLSGEERIMRRLEQLKRALANCKFDISPDLDRNDLSPQFSDTTEHRPHEQTHSGDVYKMNQMPQQ